MANNFFPCIPRELNRCVRFLVRLYRSQQVNQVFGDLFCLHVRFALHHLDEALRLYARQRDESLDC